MLVFMTVFQQVVLIFFLMAIGYGLGKSQLLKAESARDITNILCYIVAPCIIIQAFQKPFDQSQARALALCFAANGLLFVLFALISKYGFSERILADKNKRLALQYNMVYSNSGFIGIPLLLAVLGPDGIFFGTAYFAVSNIFVWTHGIGLYQRRVGTSLFKILLNPNIIATVIGLGLYLCSIQLPPLVAQGLGYITAVNTPMAMFVVGASVAMLELKTIFSDFWLWLGTLLRNILAPLLTLGLLLLVSFDQVGREALLSIVLLMACPTATMSTLFAKLNHLDESFPTRLVTLSTLASLVTVPLVMALAAMV